MDGRISASGTCTEKLSGHFRTKAQKGLWVNVEKSSSSGENFSEKRRLG